MTGEQKSINEQFIYLTIGEVVCHETDVERQLEQGKAFAECNKTVFDVAMAVANFYDEQLQLRMDAYERERKALAENKELTERNDALKRQLAESNKQIMIYAKKLRKLEADPEESMYKDNTLITGEFLVKKGFEKRQYDYLYSDEVAEITAQNIDSEAGIWRVEIAYFDDGYPQQLDICTVGQMRMFLAIQGIVKQLK